MTLAIDHSKKPSRYKINPACIKHFCMAKGCGRWGCFSIGCKGGKPGMWFCSDHIAEASKVLRSPALRRKNIPEYLLPQPVRARKARRERALKKDQGSLL